MAAANGIPPEQYGLGSPATLEKIDKLFACGVGDLVDLPQIVVVGDQSSGKSSVLEGLIKKPLPRDSGLCTRFATQIVFRRAAQSSIQVSIIPEPSATPEHISRLRAWGKTVACLDSKAFTDIMKEVHEVMGLSNGDNSDGVRRPTFSDDVLRLEICSPHEEHFSVIDVPGIFKSTTEGVTTKSDIQLVRNMVKGYMNNPRSVILAVIPANVDVATQEILELASEADLRQDRTLGVLTKPDLVDKGAESAVINIINGQARTMKLGWHMIRNPGQLEMSDKTLDRDEHEMMFFRSSQPWNSIEKRRVGIDALRSRLNEVLTYLVKKEFPKVKAEIKSKLTNREKKLGSLGQQRTNSAEQMAYLTTIATQFQRLVHCALSASHGADNVFDSEAALRLSPAVMQRMKIFSNDVFQYGHLYAFLKAGTTKPPPPVFSSGADPKTLTPTTFGAKAASPFGSTAPATSGSTFGAANTGPIAYPISPAHNSSNVPSSSSDEDDSSTNSAIAAPLSTRRQGDLEELTDITNAPEMLSAPKAANIKPWLQNIFKSHRGFEIGTFNTSILATLMKKQSAKWTDLSLGLVSDVIIMVHKFFVTGLASICGDEEICRAIVDTLFDDLLSRYRMAINNTKFLLEVENSNTPMTLNHYFNENLQKSRQEKLKASLRKKAFNTGSYGEVIGIDQVLQTQAMDNDDHVILEIHDILHAYYKVSRKTFVDNVCKQAVMHFLLHPQKGPLALLSPNLISQLSPAQLEEIAGEAPDLKRTREQLMKEVASLKEAVKILARA